MELREKLRLALAAAPMRRASTLPRPTLPRRRSGPADLRLIRRDTALGGVYLTEERWSLDYRHGHSALGEALGLVPGAVARLAPALQSSELRRAAFLDIETTGLAGGTGTLAFLVGVATFEGEGLCLRQYFLAGVEGEEAMLEALSDLLQGCRAVVSFNGRGFDVPVLESRFVLNRLRPPFRELEHVDLLPSTRRLYRHQLKTCRLAAVEEAILGVRREWDIPGWAVPGMYFEYLRHGLGGPLAGVFRHNKLDVLSLVVLLPRTGRLLAEDLPQEAEHCMALAKWDEAQGRLVSAARLYRAAGGRAGTDGMRLSAVLRLLGIERRMQEWDGMERTLTEALEMDWAAAQRIRLLIELAKVKEHRRRDYAGAERLTREAIALGEVLQACGAASPSQVPTTDELERRLLRLSRRRISGAADRAAEAADGPAPDLGHRRASRYRGPLSPLRTSYRGATAGRTSTRHPHPSRRGSAAVSPAAVR